MTQATCGFRGSCATLLACAASCVFVACERPPAPERVSGDGAAPSASASTVSASPPSILPAREPDPTLRFARPEGSVDQGTFPRPKPWLAEDPNLEALLPDGEASDLKETWRIDEPSTADEPTFVEHVVSGIWDDPKARETGRSARARIDALRLAQDPGMPAYTIKGDPGGLQTLFVPLTTAPWSGLPIGIQFSTSDGLFQMTLTASLSAERRELITKFAEQVPLSKLAFTMQKEIGATLVGASFQRRRGRTPAATFDLTRNADPAAKAKLTAKLDAISEEPIGLEARMKKQLAAVTLDQKPFTDAVERSLRAHGFHRSAADAGIWQNGTMVALTGAESVSLIFGGTEAPVIP